MSAEAVRQGLDDVRRDAARWVRPEQVADPSEVTWKVLVTLLFRHPPLRAMAWFRFAATARRVGIRGVSGFVQRRLLRLYGLELAPSTPVGPGLYIAHPVGCVLHAESIGSDVTVIGQATLGTRKDDRWPTIGDRAFIGIGSRVLGGVTIGEGSVIGANAVVLTDVPAGRTAVGIPARVLGSPVAEQTDA